MCQEEGTDGEPALYDPPYPYYPPYAVPYPAGYPVGYGSPYPDADHHMDFQYYQYLQSAAAMGYYVCDSEGGYYWQPYGGEGPKLDPSAKEFVPTTPNQE